MPLSDAVLIRLVDQGLSGVALVVMLFLHWRTLRDVRIELTTVRVWLQQHPAALREIVGRLEG